MVQIGPYLPRGIIIALVRLIIAIVAFAYYQLELMLVDFYLAGLLFSAGLAYALIHLVFAFRQSSSISYLSWPTIVLDYFYFSLIFVATGAGSSFFFLYYLPIIAMAIQDGFKGALITTALAGTFLVIFQGDLARSDLFLKMASLLIMALLAGLLLDDGEGRKVHSDDFRDGLTGLITKLPFHQLVETALVAADHKGIALLVVDIDGFEDFNQRYGHKNGDLMLKEIALCLEKNVRTADTVARYSGQQFAILLPEATRAAALQTAERLRIAIANLRLPEVNQGVTVSLSLVVVPEDAESLEELLSLATKRLFRAKDLGGNRVMTSLTE